MRPLNRGASPITSDYENYRDADPELVARLGSFCSYCERRINTNLAVEHIQPKALPAYAHLEGRWDNFLLGCVNCNATKGDRDVVLDQFLLPDRDNTIAAYNYSMDGRVDVRPDLTEQQRRSASATLHLTGLDQRLNEVRDSNGTLVAVDRVAQRMECWLIAQESRADLDSNRTEAFRRQVARTAVATGFFSIWMTVFANDPIQRRMFIVSFQGTAIDCYDDDSTNPISPRPGNGLPGAGKV